MSDETPDQVTLDDLPPVDFAQLESNRDIGVCYRCSCMVMWTDDHREAHERWHAAIEDLSITGVYELPGPLGGALHFGPIEAHSAAVPAQPEEFQPLRDQLIAKLNAEGTSDVELVDQLLPVVEAWAEKYLHRATTAEAALQAERNSRTPNQRELERLRRLEQAAMDLGAPANTEQAIEWLRTREIAVPSLPHEWTAQDMANAMVGQRMALDRLREVVRAAGCPVDANVIDWIEQQLTELDEHRKHDCPPAWELAKKISQAVHDPGKFVDRVRTWDDTWDRWEYESVAAWGARAVLAVLNPLATEADPQRNAEVLTDQMLTDMLCLVGVTPTPAQLAAWTPEQREQAANWAGAVHLDASDNDVDVPERPAFLDEYPSEVCTSLYLAHGKLWQCGSETPHVQHGHPEYTNWSDAEAVAVPWPLDQEPPTGITLLIDTGVHQLSRLRRYLHRVDNNAWFWGETSTPPTHKTGMSWPHAAEQAQGELHVVRP